MTTSTAAAPRITSTEIAELDPPRLPYHEDVTHRFGIDRGQWRVLVEAIFPSAKTFDAVVMALSYCRARNLDVFKKPVHIVPMWSSQARGMIETVWPSIAELRTTAFRTGNYAGCDEAEFGPIKEQTFTGRVNKKRDGKDDWQDVEVTVSYPEWCRITVYRVLGGRVCKFVGPKVKWLESYATASSRSSLPNEMWQERPEGQLEKCAEAAALRRAFPEEIGNEYAAEEMEGRRVYEPRELPAPSRRTASDDDQPPAPPQLTQSAQPAMAPVEAREPVVINATANEPETVEAETVDDDEPPVPTAGMAVKGQSSKPAASAAPAPTVVQPSQAGAAPSLLTKDQLLNTIAKLASFEQCGEWQSKFSEDFENLEGPDQREVERAFNSKSAALKKLVDGKKK